MVKVEKEGKEYTNIQFMGTSFIYQALKMSDSDTDIDNVKQQPRSASPEHKKLKRGRSLRKLKHRAQRYRTAWESDPRFEAWLIRAPESLKARCRACNTDLTAELVVLKNHARSARHLLKMNNIPSTVISETDLESQKRFAEMKLKEFIKKHKIPSDCVDHLIKVIQAILPDSQIAQQITLDSFKQ